MADEGDGRKMDVKRDYVGERIAACINDTDIIVKNVKCTRGSAEMILRPSGSGADYRVIIKEIKHRGRK